MSLSISAVAGRRAAERFGVTSNPARTADRVTKKSANRPRTGGGRGPIRGDAVTATGEVGETFVLTFSGNVTVRQRSGATLARCEAANHRLEFTR
jgi:hypothetical protein